MSEPTPIPAEHRKVYYDALLAGRAEAERQGHQLIDDRIFIEFHQALYRTMVEVIEAATRRQVARELTAILVAHQRHRGGCLCGWNELGRSHPAHIAAEWEAIARGRGELETPPTR